MAKDESGINRLFLNGKPLFQLGPLDQGWWPDGLYTAPTDEALKYDLDITRQARLQHDSQAREGRARPLVLLVRTRGAVIILSQRRVRSGSARTLSRD